MINCSPGLTVASDWGSPVWLAPADDSTLFTITYVSVSSVVCLKLVPGLLQNFESVSVGSSVLTSDSDKAAVAAACAVDNQPMVLTSD